MAEVELKCRICGHTHGVASGKACPGCGSPGSVGICCTEHGWVSTLPCPQCTGAKRPDLPGGPSPNDPLAKQRSHLTPVVAAGTFLALLLGGGLAALRIARSTAPPPPSIPQPIPIVTPPPAPTPTPEVRSQMVVSIPSRTTVETIARRPTQTPAPTASPAPTDSPAPTQEPVFQAASRQPGEPAPGELWVVRVRDRDFMRMRWCPAGTFSLGSPAGEKGREGDEGPVRVTLSRGFWIGETEVTQQQWESVMLTEIDTLRQRKGSEEKLAGSGPDYPMHYVRHGEAVAFADSLSILADQRFFLPSEAQWEYACRAGTGTAFATGNTLATADANYNGNYPMPGDEPGMFRNAVMPAGFSAPNAWGVRDMHGNLWEWCADYYAPYPAGPLTNPEGPDSGENRVTRGGSWIDGAPRCRSASRGRLAPDDSGWVLGFRVAAEGP